MKKSKRTNIVLDEALIQAVVKGGKFPSKRSAVKAALEMLLKLQRQQRVRMLKGRIKWTGDLDELRGA